MKFSFLGKRFLVLGLLINALLIPILCLILDSFAQARIFQQSGKTPVPQSYMPVVSKAAADSFTLIDWDLGAGLVTNDQASEYKVYGLFGSSLLPSKYQSDVPIPMEGTDSLFFALKDWSQLNPTTQQRISDFLTPKDPASTTPTATSTPTSTQTSTPTVTPTQAFPQRNIVGCTLDRQYGTPQGHFVIWYASGNFPNIFCTITGVSNTLTFLQDLGNGLEDGYSAYQVRGYQSPNMVLPYQVYVVPIIVPPGSAGVTTPPGIISINRQYSPYLRVVGAHEFFHAVQMSYFQACMISLPNSPVKLPTNWVNEDLRWWLEASAQWAQHEAVSSDKSYFAFLADYLNAPWGRLDFNEYLNGLPAYARFIFATFLAERYQVDTIRQTWERYQQVGNCGSMMPAIQSALQGKGTTMEQVMPAFAEANYSLAYQSASDFRNTPIWGVGSDGRPRADVRPLSEQLLFVTGPQQQYGGKSVERLGAAYVEFVNNFAPPSVGRALTVTADLYLDNPSITPTIKFWAITQYTPTVISKTIIPNFQFITQTGSTKHYVAKAGVPGFDSYKWVTMMLVNPQTSGSSLTYTYSAGVVGPAVIYAGSDNGGLNKGWISKNGGASWISYTFPTTVRVAAAVTNTQGLVGYFGTDGPKLWKTIDGGQTFTVTQDFAIKTSGYLTGPTFSLIQVDPNNSNTIYVGLTGSGQFPDGRPRGMGALFKSTDGGATFGGAANDADLLKQCHQQTASWASTDCIIKSFAVDPNSANTLWIGQAGDDQPYQAVMRSTDGGTTWQSKMNNGVTFAKIGISNIDSNVLWVFTVNGTCSGTCMFRTTDAGGSWNSQQIDIFPFGDNAILPDPRSILSAWADAVNLKRTTDGNTSWQTIFASYSFRALGMLGTGRLFGATSGLVGAASVQWSFDDGSTWFSIGDPAMVGVSSSMNPPLSAAGYGGGLVPFVPAKNQLPKNPLYP